MVEIKVLELNFSFFFFKKKKERKRLTLKVSSLGGRGIVLRVNRRRKGASVILNIHVLETRLDKRAYGSTKVELYRVKVKVREILNSI